MASTTEIENKLAELVGNGDKADFIYDFLLLYGTPKSTITKMRQGTLSLSMDEDTVILKQKMFFKVVPEGRDLLKAMEDLRAKDSTFSHKPRFVVVTDFVNLVALDTKRETEGYLKSRFDELYINYEFFLPLTGRERYQAHVDNPADVRAAEKMAKIYDEIVKNNIELARNNTHDLNVFLTRLLFCFFAEDTGIFAEENLFTKTIFEHTEVDGSDLRVFFENLFAALDAKDKSAYPSYLREFPYVNGSLFSAKCIVPVFTAKIRELIFECGDKLNWRDINPDIFGSMFQAVSLAEVRSGLGQHYTSVPNIMKVISPLFLDELKEEFGKILAEDIKKETKVGKLQKLLNRIAKIKIFDPACGSGNFLIIAYKQLRLLEIDIIKKMQELEQGIAMNYSHILLRNFYGIEIDDFACEIARLSLYLAQHQMNCKFAEEFGVVPATLPLAESGHIVCGNACRIDWEEVCPKNTSLPHDEIEITYKGRQEPLHFTVNNEIYILGNPPYSGAKTQKECQRLDLKYIAMHAAGLTLNIDYVACWFIRASEFIENTNAKYAFVSTNSITQGEQVSSVWPYIFRTSLEIIFAYESFKWTNNAKKNAGVWCTILGIANKSSERKIIFSSNKAYYGERITPYLSFKKHDAVVHPRKSPLSSFPTMCLGSTALDGDFLKLSEREKNDCLKLYPKISSYIKKFSSAGDFIDGTNRYCLWINDDDFGDAIKIPFIKERIEKCKNWRSSKGRDARKTASKSYKFTYCKYQEKEALIIPATSTSKRSYIPVGFVGPNVVPDHGTCVIYDFPLYIFAILSSRLHMKWVSFACGRLGNGYRYSSELCYNTFPFPEVTNKQKEELERHAKYVLVTREAHSELTMADLYDPDKMPEDLKLAHESLDLAVERCYRKKPFESDEKRLEYLFKMYEKMIAGQKLDADQLELL